MSDLTEIDKEYLPKCAVCGDREVVTGYMERKKGNKLKLTFYCHGEEDIRERTVGEELPKVAFAPVKPTVKPKGPLKNILKGKTK